MAKAKDRLCVQCGRPVPRDRHGNAKTCSEACSEARAVVNQRARCRKAYWNDPGKYRAAKRITAAGKLAAAKASESQYQAYLEERRESTKRRLGRLQASPEQYQEYLTKRRDRYKRWRQANYLKCRERERAAEWRRKEAAPEEHRKRQFAASKRYYDSHREEILARNSVYKKLQRERDPDRVRLLGRAAQRRKQQRDAELDAMAAVESIIRMMEGKNDG